MGEHFKMLPDYTVSRRVQILAERLDYNHKMMNVPEMWKSTRGAGVRIAVLDTGLPNHCDLAPVEPHKSFIPNYLEDKNGHATHVAGIIAAIANNAMGVAGIAPEVDDHYVAVLDEGGGGEIDNLVKGIRWAVDELGAHIINMSLGISAAAMRTNLRALEAACNYAVSQGVTIIAAAGNESGGVGQPARYDSVIAVAAVNNRQEHARFSNIGPEVDFACGGVDSYSTYLGNSYAALSGTSMASPALAAIAALILAKHMTDGEKLSPSELKEHLKRIAYDIGPGGFDTKFGHGIPIFGHTSTPTPEEPVAQQPRLPEEVDGKLKPLGAGPAANCAYWKLWTGFISAVDDSVKAGNNMQVALGQGISRLAVQTEAIDRGLRKRK